MLAEKQDPPASPLPPHESDFSVVGWDASLGCQLGYLQSLPFFGDKHPQSGWYACKIREEGSAEVERLLKPCMHLWVHLSTVCVFVVLPALQWKLLSQRFLMLVLQCSTSLACIALSPSINKLQQDWKNWGLPEFGTVTPEPSYLPSWD